MSKDLIVNGEMTPQQMELIKSTVAKGATRDELQLFLYRCQHMGLDPLKPGQIHFVKYGSGPGTIVVGLDGFRSKAAKTGKHVGTKRGVLRDANELCQGAWCEVYRRDWEHPSRVEVSLKEYNKHHGPWQTMPETMIQKVAEVAALRMAFPDELGGLYSFDEMDSAPRYQEPPKHSVAPLNELEESPTEKLFCDEGEDLNPQDYVVSVGKFKDLKLSQIPEGELKQYINWLKVESVKRGQKLTGDWEILVHMSRVYLEGAT